eukprot:3723808-Pleurochrysis_carterae.AAC.4
MMRPSADAACTCERGHARTQLRGRPSTPRTTSSSSRASGLVLKCLRLLLASLPLRTTLRVLAEVRARVKCTACLLSSSPSSLLHSLTLPSSCKVGPPSPQNLSGAPKEL